MKCIYCGGPKTKVIDTRPSENKIWRRRECLDCTKRFTTYEVSESELKPLTEAKRLWVQVSELFEPTGAAD